MKAVNYETVKITKEVVTKEDVKNLLNNYQNAEVLNIENERAFIIEDGEIKEV